MDAAHTFHVADYVIFALTILVSIGIGVYFAVAENKQTTNADYLMGGRNMKVLPVAMSIMVSFISTIGILGIPAEVYLYGTQFMLIVCAHAIGTLLGCVFFLPLFYRLRVTSTFEYQALRYQSRVMEVVCASIALFCLSLSNGIMIFSPCVAFQAVSGVPVWLSMIVVGVSALVYTTIGGIKAVIWTDVFQAVLIFMGLIAVLALGTVKTGGVAEVWRLNKEWNHIKFFNFNPDPTERLTFWNVVIVNSMLWMSLSTSQSCVQRYCSLPSLKQARNSMYIMVAGFAASGILNGLAGVTAFAYYAKSGCDPVLSGKLRNPNQIMPYFVMDVMNYPPVPGIYTACLFSASLSSLSSGLNGAAAIAWQNILRHKFGHLPEIQQARICKIATLFFGVVGLAFGFLVKEAGGTLIQITYSVLGAIGGPLLGTVIIGALWPKAGTKGTLIATVYAIGFSLWISIGANFNHIATSRPVGGPVDNCPVQTPCINQTFGWYENDTYPCGVVGMATTTMAASGNTTTFDLLLQNGSGSDVTQVDTLSAAVRWLYSLSYFYYPVIGIINVSVISFLLSFLPGMGQKGIVPDNVLFFCVAKSRLCLRHREPQESEREKEGHMELLDTGKNGVRPRNANNTSGYDAAKSIPDSAALKQHSGAEDV